MKVEDNYWKKDSIDVFWGEIAPSHHLIQLYENEEVFLTTLEGFVTCGFRADDSFQGRKLLLLKFTTAMLPLRSSHNFHYSGSTSTATSLPGQT